MSTRISMDEAVSSFAAIADRVRARGEEVVVERGGEDICRIAPVPKGFTGRDLVDLLNRLPRPDEEYLNRVEEVANQQPLTPSSEWDR